uniref:Endoplasmic reticulum junction formation protein lunapark n=1 Tax=Graphocephala atropunctata TaxID=36148 RepID=A0A1B6MTM5_9HEMI
MGLIMSRFRRKPTTMEQLQTIEDSLMRIEDYKRHTERSQKRAVANVLIYGAALYILACVIVFVWYLPESWLVRLGLLIPLVLVPFIIYWMKRFISRYFNNKMVQANEDYADLQKKKKSLIDNVMETETFNKAREILAKYAPERLDKKLQDSYLNPEKVVAKTTDLRQRNNVNVTTSITPKPLPKLPAVIKMEMNNVNEKLLNPSYGLKPLAKPMFNKERSFSEKLVDYLIGDGPENRYALICKFCGGHNGMALKEEFPFIAYCCCFCHEYNTARSKRPSAPKLSDPNQQPSQNHSPERISAGPLSSVQHKTEETPLKDVQVSEKDSVEELKEECVQQVTDQEEMALDPSVESESVEEQVTPVQSDSHDSTTN